MDKHTEALRAAMETQSPSAPEGWKLVPVEPTEEMYGATSEGESDATYRRIYQVMLAAAPAQPAAHARPEVQMLREALDKAGRMIGQMAQTIGAADEHGDFAGEIQDAEEFAGELIALAASTGQEGDT